MSDLKLGEVCRVLLDLGWQEPGTARARDIEEASGHRESIRGHRGIVGIKRASRGHPGGGRGIEGASTGLGTMI